MVDRIEDFLKDGDEVRQARKAKAFSKVEAAFQQEEKEEDEHKARTQIEQGAPEV